MSTIVRIPYDQYEEMVRRGDFADVVERIELIFGELIFMAAPNPPHEFATEELSEWSYDNTQRDAVRVRVQGSVGIPEFDSVPLPDLLWLKRLDYSNRRPLPEDVLLVVEVSDSTLAYDRGEKARLYAQAGFADYWIVNIPKRCLEIRRDPEADSYRTVFLLQPGEEARPLAFPEIVLPVSRLFPT